MSSTFAGVLIPVPQPNKDMKRLLPFVLLLAACAPKAPKVLAVVDTLPGGILRVQNPAPSGWTDTNQIVFTEVQRIQPADGEPGELGDIMDMVVADDGSIFVTVNGPTRIDHFGADGSYLGPVGRQGSGPGEYQAVFLTWTAGHLVVNDPEIQRVSVFDPAGKYLRSWIGTCCIWRWIGSDTLGRTYIPVIPGSDDHGMGWIRYDLQGTVIDTLWKAKPSEEGKYWEFHPSKNSTSRYSIPYQPSVQDVPWTGGGVLLGDNGNYSLVLSRNGRDSALVFGRAWTPQPIPVETRQARLESYTKRNEALKAVARLEDIPTTAPAFGDFQADAEHRIWVELTVPSDSTSTYWDLFTPAGVWLGTVRAPFRARQMVFRRGEVVVSTTDADDLPMIVRYRMTEGGVGGGDAPATKPLGQ